MGLYIREGNGVDRNDGVFISRIALETAVYNSGCLKVIWILNYHYILLNKINLIFTVTIFMKIKIINIYIKKYISIFFSITYINNIRIIFIFSFLKNF